MHFGFPVVPLEYKIANSVLKLNFLNLLFDNLFFFISFHKKYLILVFFLNLSNFCPG